MRLVFASLSPGNAHAGKAVRMSAVGVKYINPIHYHGLPMTPVTDMVKAFQGRHGMVSFERQREARAARKGCA